MASQHASLNIGNVFYGWAISQFGGTRKNKLLEIRFLIHLTLEKFLSRSKIKFPGEDGNFIKPENKLMEIESRLKATLKVNLANILECLLFN